MTILERAFNLLLGLSFVGLGIRKFLERDGAPTSVVLGSSALLIWVGVMAMLRREAIRHGSWLDLAVASPSLFIGGFVVLCAPAHWPVVAQALFVLGTTLAIVSFFWLGDSFAVMPAVRTLKTQGPYRWVRHPAYLGELVLVFGCCLAIGGWLGFLYAILCVWLVGIRILSEENLLAQDLAYSKYAQKVRWRLLPRVW